MVERVTLTCDGCLQEVPGITTHRIKVDRRQARSVDLCPDCWAWVKGLEESGRR